MKWDHDNPGPFDGVATRIGSTTWQTLPVRSVWHTALVAAAATGLILVTVLAYDVATVTGAGFLFLGVCLWAKP